MDRDFRLGGSLSVGDDGEAIILFDVPGEMLVKAALKNNPNEYQIIAIKVEQY